MDGKRSVVEVRLNVEGTCSSALGNAYVHSKADSIEQLTSTSTYSDILQTQTIALLVWHLDPAVRNLSTYSVLGLNDI